jgi:high-affinity nickel permease
MLGLDNWIAAFSDSGKLALVAVVAVVLGFRHATDPDHLAAVSTLVAGTREHATRAAARLGLFWGLGHATTLFAF